MARRIEPGPANHERNLHPSLNPASTELYGIPVEQSLITYIVRDLPQLKWHWLVMIAILFVHSCVTFLMPLPNGCPTGYLGPGGFHEGGKYFNCTGGATVIINFVILHDIFIYY